MSEIHRHVWCHSAIVSWLQIIKTLRFALSLSRLNHLNHLIHLNTCFQCVSCVRYADTVSSVQSVSFFVSFSFLFHRLHLILRVRARVAQSDAWSFWPRRWIWRQGTKKPPGCTDAPSISPDATESSKSLLIPSENAQAQTFQSTPRSLGEILLSALQCHCCFPQLYIHHTMPGVVKVVPHIRKLCSLVFIATRNRRDDIQAVLSGKRRLQRTCARDVRKEM